LAVAFLNSIATYSQWKFEWFVDIPSNMRRGISPYMFSEITVDLSFFKIIDFWKHMLDKWSWYTTL
jgi:hypothetical protein